MDIANLVSQQGEMVDNIYQNVTRAEIDVDQAKDHLDKAEKYQKSARRKKLCLACVLIVVLLIILLVILIEFGAFSSSPSSETNVEPKTTIVYIEVTPSTTPITPTTSSSGLSTTTEFVENDIIVP
jgi:hypothetical protein